MAVLARLSLKKETQRAMPQKSSEGSQRLSHAFIVSELVRIRYLSCNGQEKLSEAFPSTRYPYQSAPNRSI